MREFFYITESRIIKVFGSDVLINEALVTDKHALIFSPRANAIFIVQPEFVYGLASDIKDGLIIPVLPEELEEICQTC
jgi:hypothetical protein